LDAQIIWWVDLTDVSRLYLSSEVVLSRRLLLLLHLLHLGPQLSLNLTSVLVKDILWKLHQGLRIVAISSQKRNREAKNHLLRFSLCLWLLLCLHLICVNFRLDQIVHAGLIDSLLLLLLLSWLFIIKIKG